MPNTPDILIVGGGISGVSAACAAAEEGLEVWLLDQATTIGGNAIHANVGTICGAFYRSSEPLPLPVESEFLGQILVELQSRSSASVPQMYHKGLWVVPYEGEILQAVMHHMLQEAGVMVKCRASLVAINTSGNLIEAITFLQDGKEVAIHPRQIVDCSGKAVISVLAGKETITSEVYQAPSQVFRVTGITSIAEKALDFSSKEPWVACRMQVKKSWPELQ